MSENEDPIFSKTLNEFELQIYHYLLLTRQSLSGSWKHQVNMMYWHPAAKVLRAEMIIDFCIDLICLWSMSPQLYTCLSFAWDAGDVMCLTPALLDRWLQSVTAPNNKCTIQRLTSNMWLICDIVWCFSEWQQTTPPLSDNRKKVCFLKWHQVLHSIRWKFTANVNSWKAQASDKQWFKSRNNFRQLV